jgi:hypothetical protein
VSADVHSPTNAGPAAEGEDVPTYEVYEPAPALPAGEAATSPSGPKPELLAGAAFAGGFVAAILLRRLAD